MANQPSSPSNSSSFGDFLGDVGGGLAAPFKAAGKVIGDSPIGDYFMGPTRAARAQKNAANKGMAAQERMFGEAMETQQPWLAEGQRHLMGLSEEVGRGGFDVDPGEFQYEQSPGYQFMMDEGLRGVERGAAARGNLQSGGTDIDLMRHAQGLAAQDYGNQYDRWAGDYNRDVGRQDRRFNRGFAMTGIGQQAAGNIANMQMQQGRDLSSGFMNIGNAQANRAMATQNTVNPILNLGAQIGGAYLGGR